MAGADRVGGDRRNDVFDLGQPVSPACSIIVGGDFRKNPAPVIIRRISCGIDEALLQYAPAHHFRNAPRSNAQTGRPAPRNSKGGDHAQARARRTSSISHHLGAMAGCRAAPDLAWQCWRSRSASIARFGAARRRCRRPGSAQKMALRCQLTQRPVHRHTRYTERTDQFVLGRRLDGPLAHLPLPMLASTKSLTFS